METQKAISRSQKLWLVLILLFGLLLRLWHLGFQSLWIDELYTILETAPDASWAMLLVYLKSIDPHPPVYYSILKLFLQLFGNTEIILRLPSVLSGTASIGAMFFLGRELWSTRVGLFAAAITCINSFNLEYSQEGRDYMFVFFVSILSYYYFLRFLKNISLKGAIVYGFITLLVLYSHYFSVFLVFSQAIIASIFFVITPAQQKAAFIKYFLLSAIIAVIGYLPWLPYVMYVKNIKWFWIEPIEDKFLTDFFYTYFGNNNFLKPLLLVLLLSYLYKLFNEKNTADKRLIEKPLEFSFVILVTWVLGTCIPPYIRSQFVIPMLVPRYTIIVMPAYLVAVSMGIEFISNRFARSALLSLFIILSLLDIFVTKRYYTIPRKSQYREMTHFIVARNPEHYPIVEEPYSWQHNYYFKRSGYNASFITSRKELAIDSIMKLVGTPNAPEGFWLAGGHAYTPISDDYRRLISSAYLKACDSVYFGARAELHYLYKTDSTISFITSSDVRPENNFDWSIAVWGNNPFIVKKMMLPKGKYDITLSARSTAVKDTFANIALLMDDKKIGEFKTSAVLDIYKTTVDIAETKEIAFQLALTNDAEDNSGERQDRNAFVRFIRVKRLPFKR